MVIPSNKGFSSSAGMCELVSRSTLNSIRKNHLNSLRIVIIILGVLFSLASLATTILIYGLVQLVGMGKGFWSVWITQLDIFCIVAALIFWIVLAILIRQSKRRNRISN